MVVVLLPLSLSVYDSEAVTRQVVAALAAVVAVAAVADEDRVQRWRRGGRSLAAAAFDGDGGGGYG